MTNLPPATAIINARIYTVDHRFTVYGNGVIVFDEAGIRAVGPSGETPIPPGTTLIDAQGRFAPVPMI